MNIANIHGTDDWFQVLQTTERSQTAVMTLEVGKASGEEPDSHPGSDQILLVLEGHVRAEIGTESVSMKTGDVVIVPADTRHRFLNEGDKPAVTFSVYAPPAYNQAGEELENPHAREFWWPKDIPKVERKRPKA